MKKKTMKTMLLTICIMLGLLATNMQVNAAEKTVWYNILAKDGGIVQEAGKDPIRVNSGLFGIKADRTGYAQIQINGVLEQGTIVSVSMDKDSYLKGEFITKDGTVYDVNVKVTGASYEKFLKLVNSKNQTTNNVSVPSSQNGAPSAGDDSNDGDERPSDDDIDGPHDGDERPADDDIDGPHDGDERPSDDNGGTTDVTPPDDDIDGPHDDGGNDDGGNDDGGNDDDGDDVPPPPGPSGPIFPPSDDVDGER